ncbi:MAG: phosphohistidine phosphatase SixA [Anaerolineae bacterium]|nr:phosphohistidine phosphatase SixA [Anaerolineae bacterium]
MRVYLVRHGKASKDPAFTTDADRPLTRRGRNDITRIAAHIAQAGCEIHQIRHSGLVRARETADILGEHINPPGGVIAVAGLHYTDPVDTLAHELSMEPAPVMLVGHNPFMEDLAGLLLTGNALRVPVRFTTSCVVCLEYTGDEWWVRWVLNPEIVPES